MIKFIVEELRKRGLLCLALLSLNLLRACDDIKETLPNSDQRRGIPSPLYTIKPFHITPESTVRPNNDEKYPSVSPPPPAASHHTHRVHPPRNPSPPPVSLFGPRQRPDSSNRRLTAEFQTLDQEPSRMLTPEKGIIRTKKPGRNPEIDKTRPNLETFLQLRFVKDPQRRVIKRAWGRRHLTFWTWSRSHVRLYSLPFRWFRLTVPSIPARRLPCLRGRDKPSSSWIASPRHA